MSDDVTPALRAELAPKGVLRAAINIGNFLLVMGKTADGDPVGVSPDMAHEIARRLDVTVQFVPYPDPGLLADAAPLDAWDIGNIGAEPQRAKTIAFTSAYAEIEATYLVPEGSPLRTIAEVDQPGLRIATKGRAAYGLWLQNNIQRAELVCTDTIDASLAAFLDQGLEALARLRPRLLKDLEAVPGARLLDGQFSAVQQAVGTPRKNAAAARWLAGTVEQLKASGFVADAIARHQVSGLSVAPAAKMS